MVIMITRGNNAPGVSPVNPGSLKTFSFKDGVLTQLAAIQPGDGLHFGPRHLDFHPTQPWVYVSIESQNKLYVYKRDPVRGLSRDPIFMKETLADPAGAGGSSAACAAASTKAKASEARAKNRIGMTPQSTSSGSPASSGIPGERCERAARGVDAREVVTRVVIAAALARPEAHAVTCVGIPRARAAQVDERREFLLALARRIARRVAFEGARDASIEIRGRELDRVRWNNAGIEPVEPT